MLRSKQFKQIKLNKEIRRFLSTAVLLGLPVVLNACGILNGEPIRLWDSRDKTPPAAPANPASQRTTPVARPSAAPSSAPSATPQNPAGPCKPTASASLESDDATLSDINTEVSALENTQPKKKDLIALIKKHAESLSLSHQELHDLAEGILTRSASDTPASQPQATSSPTPASSQYFLHPSILAFVVHKRAAAYGQIAEKMGLDAKGAKTFADGLLNFPNCDVAFATYVKAIEFAVSKTGLQLKWSEGKMAVDAILKKPNGIQLALGYIQIFTRDVQDYGYSQSEAIADANRAACISPDALIAAGAGGAK